MGYCGFGIIASDTAIDVLCTIEQKTVEILRKNINYDGGGCNTDGIINVAMIVDEGKDYFSCDYVKEYTEKSILPKLKKYIEYNKKHPDDWDSKKNYNDHIKYWQELYNSLENWAN